MGQSDLVRPRYGDDISKPFSAARFSAAAPRLLDRQGWSTLLAGSRLLLISFTANYGDDKLSRFLRLPAHDQVGICLHLAALAALAGVDEVFSVGGAFSKRRSCSTGDPSTTLSATASN